SRIPRKSSNPSAAAQVALEEWPSPGLRPPLAVGEGRIASLATASGERAGMRESWVTVLAMTEVSLGSPKTQSQRRALNPSVPRSAGTHRPGAVASPRASVPGEMGQYLLSFPRSKPDRGAEEVAHFRIPSTGAPGFPGECSDAQSTT